MRRFIPFSLFCAVVSFSAGCQHRTGSASFEFIDPTHIGPLTDARKLKLKVGTTVFVDAKPIEPLTIPTYPPSVLATNVGPTTIAVSITVGADGRVKEVNPSFGAVAFRSRYDDEFQKAIEAALATWRFEPAQRAQLEPSKDGPPIVQSATDTETSFDVLFTFTTSGSVSTGFPKK
jgi:hypothetical protein